MASISVRDVTIDFPIYQGNSRSLKKALLRAGTGGRISRDPGNRVVVRALDNMSLNIEHGERVGLVGVNGSGKTTLLRALAGVYEPSGGTVTTTGAVSALFDIGIGINPDNTGYENILLRGLYMGMAPKEIESRIQEIAEFTELGDYLAMPMRTYSAGMTLRLAFGVATSVNPEILLMDEWLLTGDSHFLAKAKNRLENFVNQSSILVLASHTDEILLEWCTRLLLIDSGRLICDGAPREVLDRYNEVRQSGGDAARIGA